MRRAVIAAVPANVFFLGLVSFLTDISSEMTLSLLPLFLVNVLGTGPGIVGIIEGVAESTAILLRLVSGYFSDLLGRRKPLVLLGYGLSSVAKPLLYFAASWGLVFGVRFADRLGKGVRTAPRDALVAASSPEAIRGRSFGLHRALDTYGAVVGLGIAALIVFLSQQESLMLSRGTFQKLVLGGVVPGFMAVAVLLFLVKEVRPGARSSSMRRPSFAGFGRNFKLFLGAAGLFGLGKFSDAFFVLRAQDLGLSPFYILLLLVMFNLVYAFCALPAGILSDRWGRRRVLGLGWASYALTCLGFALTASPGAIVSLFILYGFYYGVSEGVSRAFVADLAGERVRGTAYGLYHGVTGMAALPASLMAGFLWQATGPRFPFLLGAFLSLFAVLGLFLVVREMPPKSSGSGG